MIFPFSTNSVEHLLSIVSLVFSTNNCPAISDPIEAFFLSHLSQIFTWTDYTPSKAFFGKVFNIMASFLWNYMDLFVILTSVGLASRFKQINDHLLIYKGQVR